MTSASMRAVTERMSTVTELHRTYVYEQIADAVRARITSGQLADGDPVPSWKDIRAEFGVTKMTAQRAMKIIEAEGLVVTQAGMHSVVARSVTVYAPTLVAEALGVHRSAPVRMQKLPGMVVFRL
jgi:DNA-binding GntR family transcriptional regulator